jgi:hypothetical protein
VGGPRVPLGPPPSRMMRVFTTQRAPKSLESAADRKVQGRKVHANCPECPSRGPHSKYKNNPVSQNSTAITTTSRFWPRVRARALRAPVFLGALPRQTGLRAPRPSLHIIGQKILIYYFQKLKASFRPELGPLGSNNFPLDHRGFEIVYNILRPSPHLSHPSKLRCTLLSFVAS